MEIEEKKGLDFKKISIICGPKYNIVNSIIFHGIEILDFVGFVF